MRCDAVQTLLKKLLGDNASRLMLEDYVLAEVATIRESFLAAYPTHHERTHGEVGGLVRGARVYVCMRVCLWCVFVVCAYVRVCLIAYLILRMTNHHRARNSAFIFWCRDCFTSFPLPEPIPCFALLLLPVPRLLPLKRTNR